MSQTCPSSAEMLEDSEDMCGLDLRSCNSTYSLSQDSTESDSMLDEEEDQQPRVIVDMALLLCVFNVCREPGCGSAVDPNNRKVFVEGAAVRINTLCNNSHSLAWSSSLRVGSGQHNFYTINILLATYTLLVGLNISRVLELFNHLNILCISSSYYFKLQGKILNKIIWWSWCYSQEKEVNDIVQRGGEGENLMGDCKFDSRGFTAYYGTYVLQSATSNKIISLWVATKTMVSCSSEMETYAAKSMLLQLINDLKIMEDLGQYSDEEFTEDHLRSSGAEEILPIHKLNLLDPFRDDPLKANFPELCDSLSTEVLPDKQYECSCCGCGRLEPGEICCSSFLAKFSAATKCIVSSPDFHKLVNPTVLRVSILSDWEHGKNSGRLDPENFRFQGYRSIFFMLFGKQRNKKKREMLPRCAVAKVRDLFPDKNNVYKGFKRKQDSSPETSQAPVVEDNKKE